MEETSLDPNLFRPTDIKRRPQPGQFIYVPDRTGEIILYGGLARVSDFITKRGIFIDEDPGYQYTWSGLQFSQMHLWSRYGAQRARLATHEELQALKSQENKKRLEIEKKEKAEWEPRKYPIINGGLMEVPAWNGHWRSKNWAAILEVDPVSPGGFRRKWLHRGNGPTCYIVPRELDVGDAIEFGADYVKDSGKRYEHRWYGVVVESTDSYLMIQRCLDSTDVAVRSAIMKSVLTPKEGRVESCVEA